MITIMTTISFNMHHDRARLHVDAGGGICGGGGDNDGDDDKDDDFILDKDACMYRHRAR